MNDGDLIFHGLNPAGWPVMFLEGCVPDDVTITSVQVQLMAFPSGVQVFCPVWDWMKIR